jgi:RNA polymerase sigma-70 factor (ECF subfamily)
MTEESGDEDLMHRVATRDDTDAFDALFVRHRRSVYAFALRLLGPGCTAHAEDVTQETFLRLWRARRAYRFDAAASLRTYLLTITRRLILDTHKRRTIAEVPLLDADCAIGKGPERATLLQERNEALEQAIAALPPALRETVLLRDIEGLHYAEIAAILGCPVGTVRSRLNAARARLQQAMNDYEAEGDDQ